MRRNVNESYESEKVIKETVIKGEEHKAFLKLEKLLH